jgi:hypothetical protein
VYLQRDKLDEAEKSFKHALELHEQAQDVLCKADDVQRLGDVYFRRDKLRNPSSILSSFMSRPRMFLAKQMTASIRKTSNIK